MMPTGEELEQVRQITLDYLAEIGVTVDEWRMLWSAPGNAWESHWDELVRRFYNAGVVGELADREDARELVVAAAEAAKPKIDLQPTKYVLAQGERQLVRAAALSYFQDIGMTLQEWDQLIMADPKGVLEPVRSHNQAMSKRIVGALRAANPRWRNEGATDKAAAAAAAEVMNVVQSELSQKARLERYKRAIDKVEVDQEGTAVDIKLNEPLARGEVDELQDMIETGTRAILDRERIRERGGFGKGGLV